jgi:hypothetical protein
LWLRNKKIFKIEIENKIIDVWFCKIITFNDLVKECNLTVEEKDYFILSIHNKNKSIDTNLKEAFNQKYLIHHRKAGVLKLFGVATLSK